jgi:hypothetical protein
VAVLLATAACVLALRAFPTGAPLATVPLPHAGFALRYTHSVTLRPVESRYAIHNGRIVQTAEVFDDHGPGMATAPLAGERFERIGARYVLTMQRPVEPLIVRVQAGTAQTLVAGDDALELARFGERAVLIAPHCPQR